MALSLFIDGPLALSRLLALVEHARSHRELYGGADTLLLRYADRAKDIRLQFDGDVCYVHAGSSHHSRLSEIRRRTSLGRVELLPRKVAAAGPSGVVGVVCADTAGETADEVRAALAAGVAVDATRGVEAFVAELVGATLAHVRQAGALAARVARDTFVKLLEAALDGGRARGSNAAVAAKVTAALSAELGAGAASHWVAGPLVQSGGGYSTRVTDPAFLSSAARFSTDVVLYSAVMAHEAHHAVVARTYLVDASPSQLGVYESLLDAQTFLINQLRPGAVIRELVAAVTARFAARAGVPPEAKLSHTFGGAMGARMGDKYCELSSTNGAVISAGTVFGVVMGLTGVPLVDAHPSAATTVGKLSSYALLLADTVVVAAAGPPSVVTDKAPKQRSHVVYALATAAGVTHVHEQEEEEAGDAAAMQAPVTHHPDVLRQIMLIVAAHGHTREVALVTRAVADLHHDPELLARTQLEPAVVGGASQFVAAVTNDDTARVTELLDACPTAASRKALICARSYVKEARVSTTPLGLCKSPEMAQLLLRASSSLGVEGYCADVIDLVARSPPGRGSVLEVLLDSLSDEARREVVTRAPHGGETLLMHAYDGEIAQLLLDAGADVRAVDARGLDTFDHGAAFHKYQVLPVLLGALDSDEARRARVTRADAQGCTLLMRINNGEDVELLLEAGADLAALDVAGRDAFTWAVDAQNGYIHKPSVLEELLDALPSDEARQKRAQRSDAKGRTLLMGAHSSKDVRVLLRAGVDPCAVDEDGRDALGYELILDNFGFPARGVIPVLLAALPSDEARRARVNVPVLPYSETMPLMFASSRDDAQAMLGAGAELRAVDSAGCDALDHAIGRRSVDVARVLLRALGSEQGRRARVNRADAGGRTLLMGCVDDAKVVTLLLDAGADVCAVDKDGRDAIDYAIDVDDDDIAGLTLKALLAALGSKARRKERVNRHNDTTGGTPLMRAICSDIVLALLDAGADVHAVDKQGRDAFVHAAEIFGGDSDVLSELLDSLVYEERIAVMQRADLRAHGVTWGEEGAAEVGASS